MPITKSASETILLAEKVAGKISKPLCIALFGELGAGKTVFVKGLARGLGIKEVVSSPTFVLMHSYSGRMKLHHIDLYRVKKGDEFLPFEEILMDDGIVAIEWAERAQVFLPKKRIEVNFKIISENEREIVINDYRD